jgi:hypothetical protein
MSDARPARATQTVLLMEQMSVTKCWELVSVSTTLLVRIASTAKRDFTLIPTTLARALNAIRSTVQMHLHLVCFTATLSITAIRASAQIATQNVFMAALVHQQLNAEPAETSNSTTMMATGLVSEAATV